MAKKQKRSKKHDKSTKRASFTNTDVQNEAKTVLANIRFLSVDDPIRSIVITSSIPNEGKSTTSIYLTRAIASAGDRVLLIDTDMRKRSLARALGVQSQAGLYSVLTGAATLNSAVLHIPAGNNTFIDFLDVEPGIPNPPDILASRLFREFLQNAMMQYRFVIFDTPPLGAFVDAAVLSASADATILIVRPNEVKRDMLQGAYEQLQKAGANVIGAITTFVEDKKSEYYYSYYKEEGRHSRPDDAPASTTLPPMNNIPDPQHAPSETYQRPQEAVQGSGAIRGQAPIGEMKTSAAHASPNAAGAANNNANWSYHETVYTSMPKQTKGR